jgi:hypothetical protein
MSLDLTEREIEAMQREVGYLKDDQNTADRAPLHREGCLKHDHVLGYVNRQS